MPSPKEYNDCDFLPLTSYNLGWVAVRFILKVCRRILCPVLDTEPRVLSVEEN